MSGWTTAIRNRWARTGIDLDEMFAYNTAKIVRVKDRRLGLLRLLVVGAIFGYIVIYVVIIKQAYLQFETPVGTVALSLQKPDVATRVDQLPYCSQYTGPVKSNNSTARVHDPRLCVHWDATQALYPADQRDSMFITTRVSVSIETYNPNCSSSTITAAPANSSCRTPWISSPATPYYIAGIDDFTLRIAHSMQARLFYEETGNSEYAGSSDDMKGWLVDQEGNDLRAFIPGGSNFISLYEMLNATINKQARAKGDIADLSLQSDDPVGARPGESERSAGVLLFCTIVYSHKTAGKRPNYNMHVARIPGAAYKILETQRINDTARIVLNRHGVKIVFIMTGNIGRFDFQTLLVQLVSAFALLSVATLIVENAMLYVMPEKKMYKEYKFEETVDFGDHRQERRRKKHADGTITETKVQIDQNGVETVLESMDFKNEAEMMKHEAEVAQSGELQVPLADGDVTSSPEPHHRGHPHATPLMTAQNGDDAPTTTPAGYYEARPSQVELPPVTFHPLPPRGSASEAQRLE